MPVSRKVDERRLFLKGTGHARRALLTCYSVPVDETGADFSLSLAGANSTTSSGASASSVSSGSISDAGLETVDDAECPDESMSDDVVDDAVSVLGLPPWTDRAAGASAPSTSAAPAAGTLISEHFCELIRRHACVAAAQLMAKGRSVDNASHEFFMKGVERR